jgi:hypothetical protein
VSEDRGGVRGRGTRGRTIGVVQEIFSGDRIGNNGGYECEEGAELRVVTKWIVNSVHVLGPISGGCGVGLSGRP